MGQPLADGLNWAQREDFPAPVDRLAGGRVWRRAEVERWAKEKLPLPSGVAGEDGLAASRRLPAVYPDTPKPGGIRGTAFLSER